MSRVTIDNFRRYDHHLKRWHRGDGLALKQTLQNFHQTEEAGAVAFYPVGGSPLEGKVKFSFTETPPASGDKGPDNPSTITGVSSVKIYHSNSNMLSHPYFDGSSRNDNGFIMTSSSDGSVVLSGLKTIGNGYYRLRYMDFPIKAGETYYNTSKGEASAKHSGWMRLYKDAAGIDSGAIKPLDGFTPIKSNNIAVALKYYANDNLTENPVTIWPSVSIIPYEGPWEFPETVLYTLSLGNTYYGGEIDLATGLMTVTWVGKILDRNSLVPASAGFTWSDTDKHAKRLFFRLNGTATGFPAIKNATHITCSHFKLLSSNENNVPSNQIFGTFYVTAESNNWIMFYDTDMVVVDDSKTVYENSSLFLNWFDAKTQAGDPVYLVYELKEPQTVQLTPTSLLSLAQTSRHEPRLNTVYTDADSIQITYQKSPIRAATEQEQAILALGGNV